MDIIIIRENDKPLYRNGIYQMLLAADKEFVPPLSARASTTQSDLIGKCENADGIRQYFDAVMEQKIMIATEEGKLLAFMSYKENFEHEYIDTVPNVYISTLTVKPEGRGKGLTKKMYRHLLTSYPHCAACTRTWSTNFAHTKILSDLGFDEIRVLKNDRGVGIDTVYYIKRPEKEI